MQTVGKKRSDRLVRAWLTEASLLGNVRSEKGYCDAAFLGADTFGEGDCILRLQLSLLFFCYPVRLA